METDSNTSSSTNPWDEKSKGIQNKFNEMTSKHGGRRFQAVVDIVDGNSDDAFVQALIDRNGTLRSRIYNSQIGEVQVADIRYETPPEGVFFKAEAFRRRDLKGCYLSYILKSRGKKGCFQVVLETNDTHYVDLTKKMSNLSWQEVQVIEVKKDAKVGGEKKVEGVKTEVARTEQELSAIVQGEFERIRAHFGGQRFRTDPNYSGPLVENRRLTSCAFSKSYFSSYESTGCSPPAGPFVGAEIKIRPENHGKYLAVITTKQEGSKDVVTLETNDAEYAGFRKRRSSLLWRRVEEIKKEKKGKKKE